MLSRIVMLKCPSPKPHQAHSCLFHAELVSAGLAEHCLLRECAKTVEPTAVSRGIQDDDLQLLLRVKLCHDASFGGCRSNQETIRPFD